MPSSSATPPRGRPPGPPPKHWWVYVEDALIILAIAALWPRLVGQRGTWVDALQVTTLVVLVVIGVLRLRRMLVARREAEEDTRRL